MKSQKQTSKLLNPGIILTGVLLAVAAFVLIWWPADIYFIGISLAGWLMFFSAFVWFIISVIYIVWIERLEKQKLDNHNEENLKTKNKTEV